MLQLSKIHGARRVNTTPGNHWFQNMLNWVTIKNYLIYYPSEKLWMKKKNLKKNILKKYLKLVQKFCPELHQVPNNHNEFQLKFVVHPSALNGLWASQTKSSVNLWSLKVMGHFVSYDRHISITNNPHLFQLKSSGSTLYFFTCFRGLYGIKKHVLLLSTKNFN